MTRLVLRVPKKPVKRVSRKPTFPDAVLSLIFSHRDTVHDLGVVRAVSKQWWQWATDRFWKASNATVVKDVIAVTSGVKPSVFVPSNDAESADLCLLAFAKRHHEDYPYDVFYDLSEVQRECPNVHHLSLVLPAGHFHFYPDLRFRSLTLCLETLEKNMFAHPYKGFEALLKTPTLVKLTLSHSSEGIDLDHLDEVLETIGFPPRSLDIQHLEVIGAKDERCAAIVALLYAINRLKSLTISIIRPADPDWPPDAKDGEEWVHGFSSALEFHRETLRTLNIAPVLTAKSLGLAPSSFRFWPLNKMKALRRVCLPEQSCLQNMKVYLHLPSSLKIIQFQNYIYPFRADSNCSSRQLIAARLRQLLSQEETDLLNLEEIIWWFQADKSWKPPSLEERHHLNEMQRIFALRGITFRTVIGPTLKDTPLAVEV